MLSYLASDLRRKAEWYGLTPGTRAMIRMFFADGSTAQMLYRTMQFCQNHHLKLIAAIIYRMNAMLGHVVIGRKAAFGPGFVIMHSFGIVVHSNVRAGRNLTLEAGVVIGEEKNATPVLGDNVYVGAGAKIVGPVRVGSDVKIGANAVVTKDIPDGATAVGIPARVIKIYGQPVTKTSRRLEGTELSPAPQEDTLANEENA